MIVCFSGLHKSNSYNLIIYEVLLDIFDNSGEVSRPLPGRITGDLGFDERPAGLWERPRGNWMNSGALECLWGELSLNLCMVDAYLCKPRENAADHTVAADAHKRKRTFCICSHTRKKPTTGHRVAAM
jgi:hypothetical protein